MEDFIMIGIILVSFLLAYLIVEIINNQISKE